MRCPSKVFKHSFACFVCVRFMCILFTVLCYMSVYCAPWLLTQHVDKQELLLLSLLWLLLMLYHNHYHQCFCYYW